MCGDVVCVAVHGSNADGSLCNGCHAGACICAGPSDFSAAAAKVAAMAAFGVGSEAALPPLPARSSLGSRDSHRSMNQLLL